MRSRLLVHLVVLALASAAAAATPEPGAAAGKGRIDPDVVLERIADHRSETWRWERLMRVPRTPVGDALRAIEGPEYRQWVLTLWRKRAERARARAARPPHRAQWGCIHRYERHPRQGWATNTGNGYYGGLQMDIHFQRAYGAELLRRKGTADKWTPVEQMWVAERAYRTRGFTPWPNTARACGLF